jgi:molybdopterin-guanine dinucleotide biosynthesis protein A
MGRSKALLPYRGKTLAEEVADTLKSVTGYTAFVGGAPGTAAGGIGFVPDLYPGEGPLGGILSALRNSPADWNLIVACDMPEVRADFLSRLLNIAEQSNGDAVLPTDSGQLEPLCAAYHRRCFPALSEAFGRGVRKIATALRDVPLVTWQVPKELSCFQNVNTPEDWAPYDK